MSVSVSARARSGAAGIDNLVTLGAGLIFDRCELGSSQAGHTAIIHGIIALLIWNFRRFHQPGFIFKRDRYVGLDGIFFSCVVFSRGLAVAKVT